MSKQPGCGPGQQFQRLLWADVPELELTDCGGQRLRRGPQAPRRRRADRASSKRIAQHGGCHPAPIGRSDQVRAGYAALAPLLPQPRNGVLKRRRVRRRHRA
ncbi:hypothetical protein ACPA9J_00180 [Pseudomonas aeruginosa]